MDFWFVATVSALLLFSVDSVKTLDGQNSTTPSTNETISDPTTVPCPSPKPSPSAPILGFFSVQWGSKCEGNVMLNELYPASSKPVCHTSKDRVKNLLTAACEEKKGCEGLTETHRSKTEKRGVQITENGLNETQCEILTVTCKEERPLEVPSEPVGYRVATALLCLLLILVCLVRFARPTITALQKRFSNKRQNRWIGPTQSHSVSYHRGQNVNKNMDGDKHSSYPALDRLTVGNREPSSNRNSYNF